MYQLYTNVFKMMEKVAIGSLVNGVWSPPTLTTQDNYGQRITNFYVRMISTMASLNAVDDWDTSLETMVPITQDNLNDEKMVLPEGHAIQYWSESGRLKIKRYSPTYVSVGKAKRSALHQAINEVISKWNEKQRKHGYSVEQKSEEVGDQSGEVKVSMSHTRIRPVALGKLPAQNPKTPFNIEGKQWQEGVTVYVQPKFDGDRLLAYFDKDTSSVMLYGRQCDDPPNRFEHIRQELARIFDMLPRETVHEFVLDGEVYKHGMSHQKINAIYSKASADSSDMDYYIFDCIMPNRDANFEQRLFLLNEIKSSFTDLGHVKVSIPEKVSTSADIQRLYLSYLDSGYEGAVVRFPTGKYPISTRKESRSSSILKLKPCEDDEFEIIGYSCGTGQNDECIIWRLKTPTGKEFNVSPKGDRQGQRELYRKLRDTPGLFESNYLGKMMTIQYNDTTLAGVPKFANAIGVRELGT